MHCSFVILLTSVLFLSPSLPKCSPFPSQCFSLCRSVFCVNTLVLLGMFLLALFVQDSVLSLMPWFDAFYFLLRFFFIFVHCFVTHFCSVSFAFLICFHVSRLCCCPEYVQSASCFLVFLLINSARNWVHLFVYSSAHHPEVVYGIRI